MNKISFDVRGDVCYYNVHDNNVNKLFLFNGLSNRFGSPYRILLDAASAQPRNKADYFQLGSENASYHITTDDTAHLLTKRTSDETDSSMIMAETRFPSTKGYFITNWYCVC